MINQDKINEALLFASIKHEGQKMKQPDVGYVTHLQGVCLEAINGCLNNKSDVNLEKVIVLSLLHDTIEDTGVTYKEVEEKFGKEIADGVMALTKNDSLRAEVKMQDSIKRIREQGIEVCIVKLADRLFNLKDIPLQWSENKVESYKEEAKLILKELGFANEYMAKRMKDKIEKYHLQFFKGKYLFAFLII